MLSKHVAKRMEMSNRTDKIIMSNETRVLKQLRTKKGLSMRAAGNLIGRSDSYVSQIENGRMSNTKKGNIGEDARGV